MSDEQLEIVKPVKGRPLGTTETVAGLYERQLIQHLKVYQQLLDIAKSRIRKDGDNMDPEVLAKLMDMIRRGIVDLSKPIVAPARAEAAPKQEEEDPEKILQQLTGGSR